MGVELLCHSPIRPVSRTPSRAPTEGVGAVYLSDFATAGNGASQHTQIAAAYATGKEVRIRAGEYFKTTSKLTLPANSRTRCENPQTGGFILDVQSNPGIQFGDGSVVNGLGAKSLAYLASAINDTTDYSLGQRGLMSGNNCQFNDVYMTDLCGGIDIDGKTGVTLSNINGTNIRSRLGEAAVVHCHIASNIVGVGIYGTDCDRFIEVEASSHDYSFTTGTGTNIYPNGFVGQSGSYATYSFVLDLGHAHSGEGGCYNGTFSGFTLTNCLGGVMAQRSTGTTDADLTHDVSATNVTINSPRGTSRFPVELQGYNIALDYITFGGTPNTTLTQLIKTLVSTPSANIDINHLTIPSGFYGQQIALLQGNGSKIRNMDIGPRNAAITTSFFAFRAEGNDNIFDGGTILAPTYGTAIWSFKAGITGCQRINTTWTVAGANPVSAAVALNGNTVTQSNNSPS